MWFPCALLSHLIRSQSLRFVAAVGAVSLHSYSFVDNYFELQLFLTQRITDPKQIRELQNYGEMHRHFIEMIIARKNELPQLNDKIFA
jgi:hypothetical protein